MIAIRELIESDIGSIVGQLNSRAVSCYLSSRIPFPYTREDAKWFVENGCKSGINRAIDYKGQLVGVVGVVPGQFEYERSGEIGYWVGELHWGLGIATMAVSTLTAQIFTSTKISHLVAPVFRPNKPSMRVLEKCGYDLESVQKRAIFKDNQVFDAHIFVKFNS